MFIKIEVQTRNKVDLVDVTDRVKEIVTEQGVEEGICFLFSPHTTAGLVLNENWDPAVQKDVALALDHMAPEGLPYRHNEGNSPAHVKSILVGADHFIFIQKGKLQLGRWQGVFYAEFDGPRRRQLWVRLLKANE
jgi:secondary thiamine-phosphate synthase enzyme